MSDPNLSKQEEYDEYLARTLQQSEFINSHPNMTHHPLYQFLHEDGFGSNIEDNEEEHEEEINEDSELPDLYNEDGEEDSEIPELINDDNEEDSEIPELINDDNEEDSELPDVNEGIGEEGNANVLEHAVRRYIHRTLMNNVISSPSNIQYRIIGNNMNNSGNTSNSLNETPSEENPSDLLHNMINNIMPNISEIINNIGDLSTFRRNTGDICIVMKKEDIDKIELISGIEIKDQDKCTICLDNFNKENIVKNIRKLNCNHIYHQECIDTWLTTEKNICPQCRVEVGKGYPLIDGKINEDI